MTSSKRARKFMEIAVEEMKLAKSEHINKEDPISIMMEDILLSLFTGGRSRHLYTESHKRYCLKFQIDRKKFLISSGSVEELRVKRPQKSLRLPERPRTKSSEN